MTSRELIRIPAMRAALGVLAVAISFAGWTMVRALRADHITDAAPIPIQTGDALRGIVRPPPPSDFGETIDRDPFSPDRSPPSVAYRMPGEPAPDATPAPEPIKPIVIGTAVSIDGRSFATVQLGDAKPVIVRLGDHIGDYVVKSIERGRVGFLSSDNRRVNVDAAPPNAGK